MQQEIKLSELKTLLISAKNELNSMLSLNRTKKIKYEEKLERKALCRLFTSLSELPKSMLE